MLANLGLLPLSHGRRSLSSKRSTCKVFRTTLQASIIAQVRPRHSIEASLLPKSAVLQAACSGLSFAHAIFKTRQLDSNQRPPAPNANAMPALYLLL